MRTVNRRVFVGASIGLVTVGKQTLARAALQCLPTTVPSSLSIDCSVGRNLQLFLKNPSLFGLTGVCSMTAVQGELGNYAAGSLFVYPWLKSQNQGNALAAELSHYQAFLPGPIPANPLPNMSVPLDEQFCTYGLQAPAADFIGFAVDTPRTSQDPHLPWYSVAEVGGASVGIAWASDNLTGRWFGGSSAIPANDCDGGQWRQLILNGLRQAATMTC